MDIGKKRDAEVYQVTPQIFALSRALERNAQGGGGGHGADSGEIGRAIVADYLAAGAAGVDRGAAIEHCEPDKVAHHDNQNHNQEDRQLMGNFSRPYLTSSRSCAKPS